MKADAITPGNCKLATGSLATLSNDLAKGRIVKMTRVQHDYVMMTRRRPFYRSDGRRGCVSTPVVVVISVLSVVSSVVCNVGTYKLSTEVCTIRVRFNRIIIH